ncbi:MAG: hypothetical protein OXC95_03670 [Dehalococcoidia bacterium]|nr:hypothetical protein [Dehalococcoidia bacterium]
MTPEEIQKAIEDGVKAALAEIEKADEPSEEEIAKAYGQAVESFVGEIDADQAEIFKAMPEDDQHELVLAYIEDPEGVLGAMDEASDEVSKSVKGGGDTDLDISALSVEDKAALFDEMHAGAQAEDAAEEVQKGLDDEIAKRDERIEALEARLGFEDALASAKEKFQHLPGNEVEKAAMISALGELPKETREVLEKALLAGNESIQKMTTEIGEGATSTDGDIQKATDFLAKRAAEIKKDEGISYSDAYRKAAMEPKGQELVKAADATRQAHILNAGEAV